MRHQPPYRRRPRRFRPERCRGCSVVMETLAVRLRHPRRYGLILESLQECPSCGEVWWLYDDGRQPRDRVTFRGLETMPTRHIRWWLEHDERRCLDPTCRMWLSKRLLRKAVLMAL